MKKSLLAMAVGAAFLPLVAQAAPELYGRLNVSLSNTSWAESATNSGANTFGPTATTWKVSSIQNWIGLRGEVPLYNNNIKAIYQVERGVDVANGNGDLTARNTFVGLAGDNWGKVFLGTYDSLVKHAEGKVDQFNHTEADMALYIGGQNRSSNTINYSSPNFSGLTFNAQIIPGEGRTDLSTDNDEAENGLADAYGASVSFKQDTFWANLAYEQGTENIFNNTFAFNTIGAPPGFPTSLICSAIAAGPEFCGDLKVTTMRLTAGVDIGNISLAFLAQQRDADETKSNNAPFPAGTKYDSKTDFVISGSFAMTDRLKLKAQIADAGGYFTFKDDDRKIQSYTVGADYALGKNVTSYALYSMNSIDGKDAADNKDKSEYNVASVGLTLKF